MVLGKFFFILIMWLLEGNFGVYGMGVDWESVNFFVSINGGGWVGLV